MTRLIAICLLAIFFLGNHALAESSTNSGASLLITNLVEILPYIDQFAGKLDLDVPIPITTNRVSKFNRYRGRGNDTAIWIDDNRWLFNFNVKHHLVDTFRDTKHSLVDMSAQQLKALTNASALTEAQVLGMARKYLARLGFSEDTPSVMSPTIKQEKPWPVFTVEWHWRERLNCSYCNYFTMEIDGYRQTLDSFSTVSGSVAEESVKNPASAK